jgi:hypothetical protein
VTGRQRTFQQLPDLDRDYTRFPSRRLRAGTLLYRNHAIGSTPWWFESSPQGRFNLAEPNGTCYLSGSRAGALRERIGPDLAVHGLVPSSVLVDRVISMLHLPASVRAANLSSNRASTGFGVTAELASMTPYDTPRAWAATLAAAGFEAIVCRLRFSAGVSEGLALFGPAGPADWPTDPTPTGCLAVASRLGIAVIDPPDDNQLTVLPAP